MKPVAGSTIAAAATAVAVFLLYTNLPVSAAQAGALPSWLAVFIPALLGMAAVHQLGVRRQPLVIDRTFLVMGAFLGVLLVSSFAAEGYAVAVERIGVFATEGLIIYFLVRNAVRSPSDLRAAIVAMLAAATFLAGLTLIQAVTGNYEQDFMGMARRSLEHLEGQSAAMRQEVGLEDRARGPVDDPNRFAQILMMALPFAYVLGLNASRRLPAAIAAASVVAMLGAVLLTYSRGAFLTLVVLLILAAPLRMIHPRKLVAVLVAGVVLTPILVPGYTERIVSIGGVSALFGKPNVEADGATKGRTTEMLAALAAYTDHPVLGVGPGQYMPYHSVRYQALPEISIRELAIPRRAHNLYLEVAAETGTLGLFFFMAIPLLLLRDLEAVRRRLQPRRPDRARVAAAFMMALLAYLGTGVFLHLAFERYYWFVVALTAAAVGILGAEASRPGNREHVTC